MSTIQLLKARNIYNPVVCKEPLWHYFCVKTKEKPKLKIHHKALNVEKVFSQFKAKEQSNYHSEGPKFCHSLLGYDLTTATALYHVCID